MRADRQKFGPYTDEELVKLIRQEILTEDDWIWMPDMDSWLRVGDSVYSAYIPMTEDSTEETTGPDFPEIE